jgi:hypothetical protein
MILVSQEFCGDVDSSNLEATCLADINSDLDFNACNLDIFDGQNNYEEYVEVYQTIDSIIASLAESRITKSNPQLLLKARDILSHEYSVGKSFFWCCVIS